MYERILAECTISHVRNFAASRICFSHAALGERAKAAELAKDLPGVWQSSAIRADFLDGEEKRKAVADQTLQLSNAVGWQFHRLHEMKVLTPDETVTLCEKYLALLRLIFDEGEMLHLAVNTAEIYLFMARAYMKLGEHDAALTALKAAVPYVAQYDNQPETHVYQSLVLRGLTFERANYGKDYEEPYAYWFTKYIQDEEFAPIHVDARFAAVIKALGTSSQR